MRDKWSYLYRYRGTPTRSVHKDLKPKGFGCVPPTEAVTPVWRVERRSERGYAKRAEKKGEKIRTLLRRCRDGVEATSSISRSSPCRPRLQLCRSSDSTTRPTPNLLTTRLRSLPPLCSCPPSFDDERTRRCDYTTAAVATVVSARKATVSVVRSNRSTLVAVDGLLNQPLPSQESDRKVQSEPGSQYNCHLNRLACLSGYRSSTWERFGESGGRNCSSVDEINQAKRFSSNKLHTHASTRIIRNSNG